MGWGSTAWVNTSVTVALDSIFGTGAEGEAVLGTEGEHDGVVVGRRLQLEVEGDAEPLAEGQAERPVDAAAVGSVHDELRTLGLVEDPLDHDPVVGREGPESGQTGAQIGDHLLGHLVRHAGRRNHGGPGRGAIGRGQVGLEEGPQSAHLCRQLGRASRRLAQPERNGRWHVAVRRARAPSRSPP